MIGNAVANVNDPVTDNACRIPTAADALCKIAVNAIPSRIPANGLENIVSIFVNASLSFSGATAPLIVCIPNIRMEKPSMILPTLRYTVLLDTIFITIPTIATTALIVAVDRILAIPLEPLI